jgi:hypothetical protein
MTARVLGFPFFPFFAGALAACATLGSPGEGNVDLPTSGAGPFRKLTVQEVIGVAPFVLDDKTAHFRDPAALALEGTLPGMGAASVALYFVATTGEGAAARDVIVRSHADDARSFFGAPTDVGHAPREVLAPDAPWEGTRLAGPSALRVSDQIFLYYAAAGGIGLARSKDGLAFTKEPEPVLVPEPDRETAAARWETTTPHAPSVARLLDGRFRMLYAAGNAIGEAESTDGLRWTRIGTAPVLAPSPAVAPASLLPGEKPPFDTDAVGDPVLAPRVTPAGRLQIRVLYTGRNGAASAIGFAARYEDTGPLIRNAVPVFSVDKHEASPALFEWSADGHARSMLYVQQDKQGEGTTFYPALSAALAPATETLPPPERFASEP